MTKEFFIKTHCPCCGTQSCYGQIEDLPYCGWWKKLYKYPDEEYHMRYERINRRDGWRRRHPKIFFRWFDY